MAGIEILAGDFPLGRAEFGFGILVFPKKTKQGFTTDVVVKPGETICAVQITTEVEASRLGKAAEAGVAGGLLLGPVGLVLGGLLGAADKQKKTVTFSCELLDGRRFLGKADTAVYAKLEAFAFKNKGKAAASPKSDVSDSISQLERLAQLKEQGVLTDEEFQQQKTKILA
ncbi:MAG TPA: SHOCT domain-containing protein [Paucimonas sp.]|nr:SHOCT domain-containing protein [Paucimonas sp.]